MVLSGFAAATARVIVWPPHDAPASADAIVMLAGGPGRRELALALARRGYAPVLVVSTPYDARDGCPDAPPGVEVVCFVPDPKTTQGEARATAALAAGRGWRSILVVAGRTQTVRARLRMRRCFDGTIRVVPAAVSRRSLPYMIAYEWGALAKAHIWQRSC
jgi:hypothetical protein